MIEKNMIIQTNNPDDNFLIQKYVDFSQTSKIVYNLIDGLLMDNLMDNTNLETRHQIHSHFGFDRLKSHQQLISNLLDSKSFESVFFCGYLRSHAYVLDSFCGNDFVVDKRDNVIVNKYPRLQEFIHVFFDPSI